MLCKTLPVLILTLLGLVAPVSAETVVVAPTDAHQGIDTRLMNATVRTLRAGSTTQRQKTIARVQEQPQRYAPPVFYALAQALFQQGDREDSLFWFYAGQLRARFDANRCADVSARAAVGALNEEYGPPINRYAFRNLAQLEELIPKVVAWDRRTPHDYDHRWINLHGMGALTGGDGETRALSLPQEQWQAIAERTRDDYLRGFREAMAQAKQVGSEERETPRDE